MTHLRFFLSLQATTLSTMVSLTAKSSLLRFTLSPPLLTNSPKPEFLVFPNSNSNPRIPKMVIPSIRAQAGSTPDLGLVQQAIKLVQASPPTWQSALLSNLTIFLVGSPILVSGLSLSGIAAAFLLGTLTWRAFGPSGFLLVATYFVLVS